MAAFSPPKNTENGDAHTEGMMEMDKRGFRILTTPQEIAQSLLMELYTPTTATVLLDSDGAMTGIRLFDTLFGGRAVRPTEDCVQAWMICGHPDGSLELSEEELRNLDRLRESLNVERIRVFLAGEDIGVIELPDEP